MGGCHSNCGCSRESERSEVVVGTIGVSSVTQESVSSLQVVSTQSDAQKKLAILDKVGASASLLCVAHCLAMPLVITVLPFVGLTFFASEPFEIMAILFSLSMATLSLCWGTRIHGEWRTLLFVLAGVVFFTLGHEFGGDYHWLLMAIGGASLALGHILNRRLCKSCSDCSH
mgnify:CR=1 FL=1